MATAAAAATSLLPSVARRLEGKVTLITGGAGGIGRYTAKLFAGHGARVVVTDVVKEEEGRALCQDLDVGGAASYVRCDVTDESDVSRAVDAAVSLHGKLDIMFNNAGIFGKPDIRLLESDRDNFERVLRINVLGCFLGTKHAARAMIPAGGGSIVMTASVASVTASLTPAAYTCSKHAVLGLMRSAALELGRHGVRVNCVSPSVVATPLATKGFGMEVEELEAFMAEHAVLKRKRLRAEDVAQAALYLASDESKFVNGLNLLVDGGFTSNGYFSTRVTNDKFSY